MKSVVTGSVARALCSFSPKRVGEIDYQSIRKSNNLQKHYIGKGFGCQTAGRVAILAEKWLCLVNPPFQC